jgi:hypothetical protein
MSGGYMKNLVLLLIALFAVVTFIRAFDKAEAGALHDDLSRQSSVEIILTN